MEKQRKEIVTESKKLIARSMNIETEMHVRLFSTGTGPKVGPCFVSGTFHGLLISGMLSVRR